MSRFINGQASSACCRLKKSKRGKRVPLRTIARSKCCGKGNQKAQKESERITVRARRGRGKEGGIAGRVVREGILQGGL